MSALDDFGAMLFEEREVRGVGMREAADQAGVGLHTWFRAEHGENITAEVLLKLMEWLGGDLALLRKPHPEISHLRSLQQAEGLLRQVAQLGERAGALAEKVAVVRELRSSG